MTTPSQVRDNLGNVYEHDPAGNWTPKAIEHEGLVTSFVVDGRVIPVSEIQTSGIMFAGNGMIPHLFIEAESPIEAARFRARRDPMTRALVEAHDAATRRVEELEAALRSARRAHTPKCRLYYATGGATKDPERCHPVDCGADAHNAAIDRALAGGTPQPLMELCGACHAAGPVGEVQHAAGCREAAPQAVARAALSEALRSCEVYAPEHGELADALRALRDDEAAIARIVEAARTA